MATHRLSQPLAVTLGDLISDAKRVSIFTRTTEQAQQRRGDRYAIRRRHGYDAEHVRLRQIETQVGRIGMLIEGARFKIDAHW